MSEPHTISECTDEVWCGVCNRAVTRCVCEGRYMMATVAIHQLGDLSREVADLCYVRGQDSENWYGAWVTGLGFFAVRFPKASTRELTAGERARYHGQALVLGGAVSRLDMGLGI